MILRKNLINVTIPSIISQASNKVIHLIKNYIPSSMLRQAQSHVVLEQQISEVVPIYKDAIDYVVCQLRSTIQHEATHRSQEMNWQATPEEERIDFKELTDPSKAEIEPQRAEENCIPPQSISGQTENISINELFERAKSQANIDPSWKNDIMAATLVEGVAGQYLMKSMIPDQMMEANSIGDGIFRYGNKLLIDVRKQVQPWIAAKTSMPSNIQTSSDGAVTQDPDIGKLQQSQPSGQTFPSIPAVPNVPSI